MAGSLVSLVGGEWRGFGDRQAMMLAVAMRCTLRTGTGSWKRGAGTWSR